MKTTNATNGMPKTNGGADAPVVVDRGGIAARASANPMSAPHGNGVRWSDLPRALQMALDRTPRAQWYRIRPIVVQSPETHKILDIARLADQILPRSTLGIRRKMATKEERARKVAELIENLDAFWSAVDALETAIERVARAAGVYGIVEFRKRTNNNGAAAPARTEQPKVAKPAAPQLPPVEFLPDEDDGAGDDEDEDEEAAA